MIILYVCRTCRHVFDEELLRTGWKCGCGSMMFGQIAPSFWAVVRYIIGHPFHAIRRILAKEDK